MSKELFLLLLFIEQLQYVDIVHLHQQQQQKGIPAWTHFKSMNVNAISTGKQRHQQHCTYTCTVGKILEDRRQKTVDRRQKTEDSRQ